MAGYHLQQAAEKYLKAVVLRRGLPVEHGYDLVQLLTVVAPGLDAGHEAVGAAALLGNIYPRARYPGNLPEPTSEEARALVQAAGVLRAFARGELGL